MSIRAHEVRLCSTSLAFRLSVSLAALMHAAFWRSETTFSDYYLRDVRRLRYDGVGSCGAACSFRLRWLPAILSFCNLASV